MNEKGSGEDRLALIDRLCEQLVTGFREGKPIRIEELLLQVPVYLRDEALEDLVAEELEERRRVGEQPEFSEYQKRFSGYLDAIARGFQHIVKDVTLPSKMVTNENTSLVFSGTRTITSGPSKFDRDQPTPIYIGPYEVVRELGEGSYGRVFMAWDARVQRHVAIKVPKKEYFEGGKSVDSFLEEARLAAKINDPGLVIVYSAEEEAGWPYIVQEFIDGTDLGKWMKSSKASYQEFAKLLIEIGEAVAKLHQKRLIHRDLKPGNILIDKQGRAHVADFGLAVHESTQWARAGEIAGTYRYMSPEQLRGETHLLDGRSDIWSIGVILYEMLVGESPFPAKNLEDLRAQIRSYEPRPPRIYSPSVPLELSRICLKCLQQRRNDRYDSALDLVDDLRHWCENPNAEKPNMVAEAVIANSHAHANSSTQAKSNVNQVVPKGLRSFDEQDADFFLDLLPGPRDRNGLPESIRFWKTRIEQIDSDKTFSIGLIYGPSGCGKSSLMKAGLLPLLDSSIITVYVEATAEDTEVRLLKRLRKHFPSAPNTLSLPELLEHLRRSGLGADRKLLILLDQFEQWLHVRDGEESNQLVDALRQCDGAHLQCIVLVRDDFWMPATRFMRSVESKLIEGQNSLAIDLFPIRHAEEVLSKFGRAFGTLPSDPNDQSQEQAAFIQQAVAGLASADGKVICVQLSLFAEMMKNRPWTSKSLKDVGGTKGVGVTFLDEMFSASTAPPEHRLHEKGAREVLKSLLPTAGTDIKGNMRSHQHLLNVSGYSRRPREFVDLIRILDSDLRLITPTDPGGISHDGIETLSKWSGEKHYQLTHDYLVPSLRDWLTRKQQETRRGRAELKLAERATIWSSKRETKQLPTVLEWLGILLLTRRKEWTEIQKDLMQRATRLHGVTWGGLLLLIIIAGISLQQAKENDLKNQTLVAVKELENAVGPSVPFHLEKLDNLPLRHVLPALQTAFASAPNTRIKLSLAFGLAHLGKVDLEYLMSQIDMVEGADTKNLHDALCADRRKAVDALNAEATKYNLKPDWLHKVRLAIAAGMLGDLTLVTDVCKDRLDPEQRTLFIDEFHRWEGDTKALRDAVVKSQSEEVRSAICIAVGLVPSNRLLINEKEAWAELAREWYLDKSRGPHSAAGWLLRTWDLPWPKTPVQHEPNLQREWFVNSVGSTMLLIPAGKLKTNSKESKELVIESDYWAGDREVSVGQILEFMNDPKYSVDEKLPAWSGVDSAVSPTPDHPAQKVSYYDSILFCNWLSRHENRSPSYERTGKKELSNLDNKEYDQWRLIPGSKGYRLLTDVEWEYMCRANTLTKYSCGDNDKLLPAFCEMFPSTVSAVCGKKLPNRWGFFDAHGNVWEWCDVTTLDLQQLNIQRVARGGSCGERASSCGSEFIGGGPASTRVKYYGFRIARTPD